VSPGVNSENIAILVSGVYSDRSLDHRIMASEGMVLLGRTESLADGKLHFADDLRENIELGNKSHLDILEAADKYIAYNGLDFPEDPEAHLIVPVSKYELDPIRVLDLASSGIKSIIWATGFTRDYSWIDVDIFDKNGNPIHQRGISIERGIYFLGLPFQSRRSSSFIFGVSHDARYLAEHIETKQKYHDKNLK